MCKDARYSISHDPIPVPVWLRLESEPELIHFKKRELTFLDMVNEGTLLRCVNGHELVFSEDMDTVDTAAILYTTTDAFDFMLPAVPCVQCANTDGETYFCCGPDMGNLGIFNYNNHSLFTHDLLYECLSRKLTTGEPLNSFCTITDRTYVENGSRFSFCGKATFSKVSSISCCEIHFLR